MTWLNPWAWAGLLTLAVPVLVHLLARRHARVQRFPTLRFLAEAQLLATRRARPADPLLLALRMLVLLAAVAALAQPLLWTERRRAAADGVVARAVVVDTSAGMLRQTAGGEPALDAARRDAAAAAAGATLATVIESAAPGRALAGAAAWLDTQPGRREIVLFSDFRRGTIDAADIAGVPAATGIELRRVVTTGAAAPEPPVVRHGGTETTTRLTVDGERTGVAWTWRRVDAAADARPLLLHAAGETAAAEAAWRAAAHTAGLAADGVGALAVTFPGYPAYAAQVAAARRLDDAWMIDAVSAIRSDALWAAAARDAALVDDGATPGPPFVALAHTADGAPAALAARSGSDGEAWLLVVARVAPGSVAAAALLAAAVRATAAPLTVGAWEVEPIAPAELASWQRRAGAAAPAPGGTDASDGRWFWLLALALLGAENVLRRRTRIGGDVGRPA